MSRRFRTLLLWVMVLVMPLQAVAASVMQMCIHQHATKPASVAMASADNDDTRAHGHMSSVYADCHGTAVAVAGVADEGSATDTAPTCSACAACCAMLGLMLPMALPTLAGVTQAQPAYAGTAWASEQLVRLDRPPRSASHA